MGAYLIMRPDEKIFSGVAGLKNILIACCEGCANDSIAFDKGGPLRSIVIDNDTGETRFFPAAIMGEANRLKGLLESRGFNVKIDTALNMCVISYESEGIKAALADLAKRCILDHPDAIINLSCDVGTLGLKRMLLKGIKIIPAMRTVGILQICQVRDESNNYVIIDRKRSAVISYK